MINPKNIWVPRMGILEAEQSLPGGCFEGEYTIKKYKAGTNELVQEIGPFKNLITNTGLNRIGTGGFGTFCFVGTGTAVPDVTNTALNNAVAQTFTYSSNWSTNLQYGDAPEYWVQGAGTWRFAAGVATGNLTEVGIGFHDGSTVLANHRTSSRALIVDSSGNPITITVLADEFLDVTYALRHYPYVGSDIVQTVVISGVSYTFTYRSIGVLSSVYTGVHNTHPMGVVRPIQFLTGAASGTPPALAAITATNLLTPGASGTATHTQMSYVSGSYTMGATIEAGLSQSNLAYGIRGFLLHIANSTPSNTAINSAYQGTISPAIPKVATNVLRFGYNISWSRKT